MWDNAPLLRGIANALFAFSAAAMLYGIAYYVTHLPGLFPLRSVRMDAVPQQVDTRLVLQALRVDVDGNFFTADLRKLRSSLESLPWVRNVSIRREFPDSLVVRFEEHQALGRWNGSALVNNQGEVFTATTDRVLPSFSGQDGTSAEVAQQYMMFSQQLEPLNLKVTQLSLSPRHAWQMKLDNGLVLELGREDMQQRLARFVEVYPYSLAALHGNAKYVDLRYRNGFAAGGLTG